jgi:hypothetical protein
MMTPIMRPIELREDCKRSTYLAWAFSLFSKTETKTYAEKMQK